MVLKNVGVFSAAKIGGLLYGLIGLLFGFLFSLFSIVGAAFGIMQGEESAIFGLLFGIGAIVFLPIFYGGMGFVFAALTAWLYNLISGLVGGLELEIEPRPAAGARSSP